MSCKQRARAVSHINLDVALTALIDDQYKLFTTSRNGIYGGNKLHTARMASSGSGIV